MKMRVGTLVNPYFLNLYIPNFFFFNLRVGTCPPWSHTGSASVIYIYIYIYIMVPLIGYFSGLKSLFCVCRYDISNR